MVFKLKDVFSMPATCPIYRKPRENGWYYGDCIFATITHEVDKEAALDVIPEVLELGNEPPMCEFYSATYGASGFGRYHDAWVGIHVKFEGKNYIYTPWLFYDEFGGTVMAAGRELFGFPAKLAKIHLEYKDDHVLSYAERPIGKRIFTMTINPDRALKPEDIGIKSLPYLAEEPFLNLRVIPSPMAGHPADVLQLVKMDFTFTKLGNILEGIGSLSYDSPSEEDPWYTLKPTKILSAVYMEFSGQNALPEVVKDFNK